MGISPGVGVTIVEVMLELLAAIAEVAAFVAVAVAVALVDVGGVGVRLRLFFSLPVLSLACCDVEGVAMISLLILSFALVSLVNFGVSFICVLSLSTTDFVAVAAVVPAFADGLGLLFSAVLRILFLANSLAKISGRDFRKLCNSLTYLERERSQKKVGYSKRGLSEQVQVQEC